MNPTAPCAIVYADSPNPTDIIKELKISYHFIYQYMDMIGQVMITIPDALTRFLPQA